MGAIPRSGTHEAWRRGILAALLLATLLVTSWVPRLAAQAQGIPGPSAIPAPPGPLPAANGTWVYRGPDPPVSERAGMAFDAASETTILFGGLDGLALLNATWEYNATANRWTNDTPAISPPARVDPMLAYDTAASRVILFGGAWWEWAPGGGIQNGVDYNDLWVYDAAANTWTERFPAISPPAVNGGAMAYDASADRTLLFGGYDGSAYLNETWAYDYTTNTWTNLTSVQSPPARYGGRMVFDPTVGKDIMFGGREWNGTLPRDTWSYDFGSLRWTDITPGTVPSGGYSMPMAFDPVVGASLLFGNGLGASNATWAFNASTDAWTQLYPFTSPPSGTGTMVWDDTIEGMVLHLRDNSAFPTGSGTWIYLAALTVPSAPRELTALGSYRKISLSWQPPAWDGGSAVTNYTVLRGTAPGSESAIATLGNVTSYGDTNVTNGQTYYYQVTATNAIGESPRSPEASATPSATPPDTTPPILTVAAPTEGATVNSGTVTVRGTASDNVAVARVDLSADGISWTRATGTTSWSGNLSLNPGSHTIYVQATDTSGNHALESITINVVAPGSGTPTGGDYVPYIGVGVVAAVVVACAVVYWLRRRRSGSPRGRQPPST